MRSSHILFLAGCLGWGTGTLLSAQKLEPINTYALVVGVLRWQDASVTSFATEHRKDRLLWRSLHDLGVPKQNTELLLDKEATRKNIKTSLERIARKAAPKSTLIFYYAGHGAIHEGAHYFLNYDYDGKQAKATGLPVAEIGRILCEHFQGQRVLLLADCCHSGALATVAQALARAGKKVASLTSAAAANISTGNWTFTMTLLDGFRGAPIVDADGDRAITLAELAQEVRTAMKYRECQRFGYELHGIAPGFVLCPARPAQETPKPTVKDTGGFPPKEYVLARVKETWRSGRILGRTEDGGYRVQLQDYSDRPVVRLPASSLKKHAFKRYEAGAKIRVVWGQGVWDAEVLVVEGDFHKVTYPGWPANWNEWLLSNRIVGLQGEAAKDLPEKEALAKARVKGKYSKLLRKIRVEADIAMYGAFKDWGFSETKSWGGHDKLPPGYWVYVYPHWYIWGKQRE